MIWDAFLADDARPNVSHTMELIQGILQQPSKSSKSSARRTDQSQVFSKNVKKMQTAPARKDGTSFSTAASAVGLGTQQKTSVET